MKRLSGIEINNAYASLRDARYVGYNVRIHCVLACAGIGEVPGEDSLFDYPETHCGLIEE